MYQQHPKSNPHVSSCSRFFVGIEKIVANPREILRIVQTTDIQGDHLILAIAIPMLS